MNIEASNRKTVCTAQTSVQFIYASRPSTKYFIRNTGTGSDGRSCHLRHCPHKFTQKNKIQMKHHSENTTKNMHSKDSYSAINSPHVNIFFWETLLLPKVHSKLCLETLLPHRQQCCSGSGFSESRTGFLDDFLVPEPDWISFLLKLDPDTDYPKRYAWNTFYLFTF